MSLFGALMGDLFDDEYSPFRAHSHAMQQMNRMMGGMLGGDPFGMMDMHGGGYPRLMDAQQLQQHGRQQIQPQAQQMFPYGMSGMGFGFPGMMNMQALMGGGAPSSHSYSSSSVMTMTTDETGRPQVYQATSSVRAGPDGVRETRKTVSDTHSGVRKMAVGHHINERAHIVEKERNYRTGDEEERQEYINLDEDEGDQFHQEWQERTHGSRQTAISYPGERSGGRHRHHHQQQQQQQPLAITAAPSRSVEEDRRGGETRKPGGKKLKRLKGSKK